MLSLGGVRALFLVVAFSTSRVLAGGPTFSLELVEIDGAPRIEGPADRARLLPGDVLKVEVLIRDWSPNGEGLGAYQAQLDPAGFSSGPKGFIEPVNYERLMSAGEENRDHCYIDQNDPRFIHRGVATLALTDTRSAGYRMAGIMLTQGGPVSLQDGVKRYCGTVILEVSDGARGHFRLDLLKDEESSGLRRSDGQVIGPVEYESLELDVVGPGDRGYLSMVVDRLNTPPGAATAAAVADSPGPVPRFDLVVEVGRVNGSDDGGEDRIQIGDSTPPTPPFARPAGLPWSSGGYPFQG